jgi:hypothetical protein
MRGDDIILILAFSLIPFGWFLHRFKEKEKSRRRELRRAEHLEYERKLRKLRELQRQSIH